MKLSNEFKVGALVTVGLVILILGASFLKGINPFKQDNLLYAKYDRVSGLSVSDPVTLNGYAIGRVKNIELINDGKGTIFTTFVINENVDIPEDSEARIISTDLLGEKEVSIMLGESATSIQPGDTMRTSIEGSLQDEVNELIAPVKQKANDIFASLDSVLTVVNVILQEGTIEQSLSNVEDATGEFVKVARNVDTLVDSQSERIGRILADIEVITQAIADNEDNIDRMATNFADISDTLKKADLVGMVASMKTAVDELNTTLEAVNSSEGTIGLMLNDPGLYENLDQASEDLDKLLVDLKKNPNRYVHFSVFGGGGDKKKNRKKKKTVSNDDGD